MLPKETMRVALEDVIEGLQAEVDTTKMQLISYETTIEVLRKKHAQISEHLEKVVHAATQTKVIKKKPTRIVSKKEYSFQLIERMCQEHVDTISHKWIMQQWGCNYHAASKRIQRGLRKGLLIQTHKGVYQMHPDVKQDVANLLQTSPDKVDVKKLVEILISYSKALPLRKTTEPGSENAEEASAQPVSILSAGETARTILREANRPMHGVNELYPELVRRGISVRPPSVGKILSTMKGIKRVAPNTWIIDDTPQEIVSTPEQSAYASP